MALFESRANTNHYEAIKTGIWNIFYHMHPYQYQINNQWRDSNKDMTAINR